MRNVTLYTTKGILRWECCLLELFELVWAFYVRALGSNKAKKHWCMFYMNRPNSCHAAVSNLFSLFISCQGLLCLTIHVLLLYHFLLQTLFQSVGHSMAWEMGVSFLIMYSVEGVKVISYNAPVPEERSLTATTVKMLEWDVMVWLSLQIFLIEI